MLFRSVDEWDKYELHHRARLATKPGLYNAEELSVNAERCQVYRNRQEQVRKVKEHPSEDNLWQAIIAFQEYPFRTATGLPFRYKIKIGKDGE